MEEKNCHSVVSKTNKTKCLEEGNAESRVDAF